MIVNDDGYIAADDDHDHDHVVVDDHYLRQWPVLAARRMMMVHIVDEVLRAFRLWVHMALMMAVIVNVSTYYILLHVSAWM